MYLKLGIQQCSLKRLIFSLLVCFLFVLMHPAVMKGADIYINENEEHEYTDDDIRAAIAQASDEGGDTIYLPAGTYTFDETVVVDKSVTIKGAAELVDLCIPEYGPTIESNVSPEWSSTPSNCITENINLTFFDVKAHNVRFEDLKITGIVEPESGDNMGIL